MAAADWVPSDEGCRVSDGVCSFVIRNCEISGPGQGPGREGAGRKLLINLRVSLVYWGLFNGVCQSEIRAIRQNISKRQPSAMAWLFKRRW